MSLLSILTIPNLLKGSFPNISVATSYGDFHPNDFLLDLFQFLIYHQMINVYSS